MPGIQFFSIQFIFYSKGKKTVTEIYIIVAIIAIPIWFAASNEFYSIAKEKGYDSKKYLWWTFFLGIAGALMVVALPVKRELIKNGEQDINPGTLLSDELPDL